MPIIDADTHVEEPEEAWAFMEEAEQRYRPVKGYFDESDPNASTGSGFWLIDGIRRTRKIRKDSETKTTAATRELHDVAARLRHMDEMGVEVQIIFPTFFIAEFTERPEIQTALRKSYNRWLADRCSQSSGRLRWAVVPPLANMNTALEELRWAKDHGACGVVKKGNREVGYWPTDPYFFPLYEEAERLDLPICFHTGNAEAGSPPPRLQNLGTFYTTILPVLHAFNNLIVDAVPAQFPSLRWGFIEANASWLPFVLYRLRRLVSVSRERQVLAAGSLGADIENDFLSKNNFYVTVQVDEDLPYIISHVGYENLLTGSDYSHTDLSQELGFVERLRARADTGEIPQAAIQKITYDNPRKFYAL
jgi:predicted TIM-barrel fold metal-dependent hydrolase